MTLPVADEVEERSKHLQAADSWIMQRLLHVYVHVYAYVRMCACVHVCMYVCMSVWCMHACMYMYICMCLCMCGVCMCVQIYTQKSGLCSRIGGLLGAVIVARVSACRSLWSRSKIVGTFDPVGYQPRSPAACAQYIENLQPACFAFEPLKHLQVRGSGANYVAWGEHVGLEAFGFSIPTSLLDALLGCWADANCCFATCPSVSPWVTAIPQGTAERPGGASKVDPCASLARAKGARPVLHVHTFAFISGLGGHFATSVCNRRECSATNTSATNLRKQSAALR